MGERGLWTDPGRNIPSVADGPAPYARRTTRARMILTTCFPDPVLDDHRRIGLVFLGHQPNAVDPLAILREELAAVGFVDRAGNAVGEPSLADDMRVRAHGFPPSLPPGRPGAAAWMGPPAGSARSGSPTHDPARSPAGPARPRSTAARPDAAAGAAPTRGPSAGGARPPRGAAACPGAPPRAGRSGPSATPRSPR